MFLLVSTSTLSVASIFIPGSPFLNWIFDVKEELREGANEIFENQELPANNKGADEKNEEGYPSNIAHITTLMVGIIVARFGMYKVLKWHLSFVHSFIRKI